MTLAIFLCFLKAQQLPDHRPAIAEMHGDYDLVLLGDSLVEQGNWSALWPQWRVENQGVGGYRVRDVRMPLAALIGRPITLRALVLMVGVNDLQAGAEPAVVASDYERMIICLKNWQVPVHVLAVVLTTNRSLNDQIVRLNRLLASMTDTHAVYFSDLNSLVSLNGRLDERYTTDGLHLNGLAYERFASELGGRLVSADTPVVVDREKARTCIANL